MRRQEKRSRIGAVIIVIPLCFLQKFLHRYKTEGRAFPVTLELKPYTPQPIGNAQTVEFAENGRKGHNLF